jgi:hypothetical protein
VKAVLDPLTGRFPGNLGPDIVVDVRTNSLQGATDTASDVNNDGYIIVGIIGAANGLPGGQGQQAVEISQAYGKPFAMIACGVTMADPHSCDGRAVVRVLSSATSPEFPVGSGVTLYFQDITATSSGSAPGWLVEGDGRLLEGIGAQGNSSGGVKIVGNRNAIRNSSISRNVGSGVVVQGHSNVIQAVTANANVGGDGILVIGNNNTIEDSRAGDQGLGNGSSGINVSGTGNLVKGNGTFSNHGNGITVGGGTAASPNIVKSNIAGSPGRGNLSSGIALGGGGQGTGGVVDVVGNTVYSNTFGLKVTGTGHRLNANTSGGPGPDANLACQYWVATGNFNATANTRNSSPITGADGSPFPTGCY